MADRIYESFLRRQREEGLALARDSDLLELVPLGHPELPDRYLARFRCKGLLAGDGGEVAEGTDFVVGIWFPSDYLRHVEPFLVLTWLGPPNVFHPNIRPPFLCAGRLTPGTSLVDLLYQCFEIITYHNWAAHDALCPEVSQWARGNQHRLPVDRRPLRCRRPELAAGNGGEP